MKLSSDWQVFQQINGKASFDICGGVDGWLENPVTPQEIKCSKELVAVKVRVVDESTGVPVTMWQKVPVKDFMWSCRFTDVPVGGPYSVARQLVFYDGVSYYSYSSGNAVTHIAVGDVFIIAGQSNAAGWAKGPYDDAPDINVRVLHRSGKWDVATQPLGGAGHSPFMAYAKYLTKKLGYPIGLVPRAIGGSPISTWVDGGCHIEEIKNENIGNIRGVLWYQGSSDTSCELSDIYEDQFLNFVDTIRKEFQDDNLPILTCQLNRVTSEIEDNADPHGYDKIREIQRNMPKKVNDLYVIPTVDLTKMSDNIHNSYPLNMLLGERCAKLALDVIYKKEKAHFAPDINTATIIGDKTVELSFDNVVGGLDAYGVPVDKLSIQVYDDFGENKLTHYKVDYNKIILSIERTPAGKSFVKCEYGRDPSSVIIDGYTQLPVLSFFNVEISESENELYTNNHTKRIKSIKPDVDTFYKTVDGVRLPIKIYHTKINYFNIKANTLILAIHGGGYNAVKEDKEDWDGGWMNYQAQYYVDQGYNTAAISYRSINFNDKTQIFDLIEDCKDAIRYLQEKMLFTKLILIGDSAGAHLALELANDKELGITAVIAANPPVDVTGDDFGYVANDDKGRDKASLIKNVKQIDAKVLCIHGDADEVVPYDNSVKYCELMNKAGNDCSLITLSGINHAFILSGYKSTDLEVLKYMRICDEFIEKI